MKYTYIENMLFINILAIIFVSCFSLFIYFNTDVYSKTYTKNETFKTVRFILGTSESYKTKYLDNNTKLEDGYQLIAVRINVRRIYSKKIGLETGRFVLFANEVPYYHTTKYKDYLKDLGETYINNIISSDEFDPYILVFKVKDEDLNNGIILKYTDFVSDDIKIDINPIDLNTKKDGQTIKIGNELTFTESIFKNTTLKIDSYEFNDSFRLDYKYCVEENCYDSAEYINVSASDNYDKTLLKLVGTFNYDEELPIIKNKSLFKFINKYAIIRYRENNNNRVVNIDLKEIKSKRTKIENTYFIEVPSRIKYADNIILEFNIRNVIYTYILK